MQQLTRTPLEKEKFDMAVKSEVGKITSSIIEKCIGEGMLCGFCVIFVLGVCLHVMHAVCKQVIRSCRRARIL